MPFPGVRRALQEGAHLGLWRHIELDKPQQIPLNDIMLLGAWHPQYEQLLVARKPRWGVLWTSSPGEMDMAGAEIGQRGVEVEYLHRILQDPRISFIWFGDPALAQMFPDKGFYAPYPLHIPPSAPREEPQPPGYATLFCPNTLKKNTFSQLLAAQILHDQMGLSLETNIPISWLISLPAQVHGWLPDREYQRVLGGSRLNLCCSWAETFSFQAAEAALLGVPSLGTRTIPWLPEWAICDEPNSPTAIAAQARDILERPHAGEELRTRLVEWAERASGELARAIQAL